MMARNENKNQMQNFLFLSRKSTLTVFISTNTMEYLLFVGLALKKPMSFEKANPVC
jgi:hypothetical protein